MLLNYIQHMFLEKNIIDNALSKLISDKSFDSLFSIIKIETTAHPDYVIKKTSNNKIDFKKFSICI